MLILFDLQADIVEHTVIGGFFLIDLALFDTGIHRDGTGAFSFRDPELWLSDRMMSRLVGLPVSSTAGLMGGVIGTVHEAYRDENTARAIVRIFDYATIALVESHSDELEFETEFRSIPSDGGESIEIDGNEILIEPAPKLPCFVILTITEKG